SLFPATCTDIFGARYATTNAGLLYTAKGVCGLGRAADQSAQDLYWSLVFGFSDRDDNESCGRSTCAIHAQADTERACLLDNPQIVWRVWESSVKNARLKRDGLRRAPHAARRIAWSFVAA